MTKEARNPNDRKSSPAPLRRWAGEFWRKRTRPTFPEEISSYVFSVLPASCRQNETRRNRRICRRDAGSTLERPQDAPLNRHISSEPRAGPLGFDALSFFCHLSFVICH